MRLFFVFSGDESQESDLPSSFLKSFDDAFAQRVIMHLTNDAELCTGCASFCEHCRDQYPIQFAEDVVGLLQLPARIPVYVDDPDDYLPDLLEPHDVTLAINIHEDLLLSLPALAVASGSRALIVPQDDTDWLSAGVRRQTQRICDGLGLECAFPKPACALDARNDQVVIREFQERYRIGKPKIVIQSRDGVIREARVVQSAPCGNTYYVAYNLAGQRIDADLNERVVSKYWHSFPCVGSMLTDPELGDSILHKGGFLHYQAVDEAIKEEAALKAEAVSRGEDPEQYVLMRRIAEYGEHSSVPNPLAENRMAELAQTVPSEVETAPSEVEVVASEGETAPSEVEPEVCTAGRS
ncbi:MAG: hypothetical protein KKA32_13485 [Actinobacteria bacterium]|nr:hypothetical protein [Actinomycetota bacterium]